MSQTRLPRPLLISGLIAAAWSALYVGSKISHAAQGRLGVTGGPQVSADSYAGYAPGDVTTAQLGNAAVGLIVLLLALLPLLPVMRPVNRWILSVPLALAALLLAAGAALFLTRGLVTDVGGVPFGLFCLVWSGLYGVLLIGHHRAPVEPPPPPIEAVETVETPSPHIDR